MRDTYAVDIAPRGNEMLVLSAVLALDVDLAEIASASSSSIDPTGRAVRARAAHRTYAEWSATI